MADRVEREPMEVGACGSDSQTGPRRIDSTLLFRDEREIVVVHRGQVYRLRITKADKLILTK